MKYLAVVLLLASLSFAKSAPSHKSSASDKVLAAPYHLVKFSVVHPIQSIKRIAGAILFPADIGFDLAGYGLEGLDKGAAVELKHNPFHYAFVADQFLDVHDEKLEMKLFGKHN